MAPTRPAKWKKLSNIISDEQSTRSSKYEAASELVKEHDRQRGVNLASSKTTTFSTYLNENRVKHKIDWKERHKQLCEGTEPETVKSTATKITPKNASFKVSSPVGDSTRTQESQDQFNQFVEEYKLGVVQDSKAKKNGKHNLAQESDVLGVYDSSQRAQKHRIRLLGEVNMKGSLSSNPKWQPGVGFEWHLSWESHLVALRAQTDPDGRLLMPNTLICGVGPRNKYCMWVESTKRTRRGGGVMLRRAVFLKDELENYVPEIFRKLQRKAYSHTGNRKYDEQVPICVKKYASATTGSTVTSGIYSYEDMKNALNQLVRHNGNPMALQSFVRCKGKGPWIVRVIHKRGGAPVAYVINGLSRFPERSDDEIRGDPPGNPQSDARHGIGFSSRMERVRNGQVVDLDVFTNASKDRCAVVVAKEVRAFKIPKAMVKQIVEDLESARGVIVNKIGVDFVHGMDDNWYMLQVKGFEFQEKQVPTTANTRQRVSMAIEKRVQMRSTYASPRNQETASSSYFNKAATFVHATSGSILEDDEEDMYIVNSQIEQKVNRLFKNTTRGGAGEGCQGDFCTKNHGGNRTAIRNIPFRAILMERLVNDGDRDITTVECANLNNMVPVCIKCHVEYSKLGHEVVVQQQKEPNGTTNLSSKTDEKAMSPKRERERAAAEYAEKKKIRELQKLQNALEEHESKISKQQARKKASDQQRVYSPQKSPPKPKLAPIIFPQSEGKPLSLHSLREDEDMDLFTGRIVKVARPSEPEAQTASAPIDCSEESSVGQQLVSPESEIENRNEDEVPGLL